MNALMPDYFNLGLGDSTGEDFTAQVAAQNQQLGLLDPTNQGQAPIAGGDLSIGSTVATVPNALANPTPPLTSLASLPAGLSTPATQSTTTTTTGSPAAPITTAAATLPSGLSSPNSMNLAAAASASAPGAPIANAAVAPSGMAVGGGIPNPNAIQGPQYAPAGSGLPGAFPAGMTRDSPDYPAWHQQNLDTFEIQQAAAHGLPLNLFLAYQAAVSGPGGSNRDWTQLTADQQNQIAQTYNSEAEQITSGGTATGLNSLINGPIAGGGSLAAT